MSEDGSHLICKKHLRESYYSPVAKKWLCIECELENIDTREGGTQELIMVILMWLAQEEREKISRRTKAGIQRRKNLGVWKGGRPFKTKGG